MAGRILCPGFSQCQRSFSSRTGQRAHAADCVHANKRRVYEPDAPTPRLNTVQYSIAYHKNHERGNVSFTHRQGIMYKIEARSDNGGPLYDPPIQFAEPHQCSPPAPPINPCDAPSGLAAM